VATFPGGYWDVKGCRLWSRPIIFEKKRALIDNTPKKLGQETGQKIFLYKQGFFRIAYEKNAV
jgi:hypothetical protein